jgi:hypothetical protein
MSLDWMRNPLAINVDAGIPAQQDRCEQIRETLATAVAEQRTGLSAAFFAALSFPIEGKQAPNASKSFVDMAFADKNGKAGSIDSEHELIAHVCCEFEKEKPTTARIRPEGSWLGAGIFCSMSDRKTD